MAISALIVEADPERRRECVAILRFLEFDPILELTGAEVEKAIESQDDPGLVVLGDCGGSRAALEVMRRVKAADPYVPVVLMIDPEEGAPGQELDSGALARVEWPLRRTPMEAVLERLHLYRENRHREGPPRNIELFRNLVGSSQGVQRVRTMIEQVAGSDANVLIVGESGTGKEVVARNIHYHSSRRAKPFVPLNCGAIPAELLESELFGHEKGAFTGAITSRQGRFEMANGGSLFLDEIGDMSLPMQVKLLRVLQERSFERVGSNKSINVDVRIIAATHVNLERAISEGRFREDLYYRLNVFPIETPPLRERSEDLPLLINDLTERLRHEDRGAITLTVAAVKSLTLYPWPGNVRELANLIERLTILYPNGTVDYYDLPEKYQMPGVEVDAVNPQPAVLMAEPAVAEGVTVPRLPRGGIDLRDHLNNLELSMIRQALEETNWVVAHAAKRLMMGRTTLVEKMRKYDLHRAEEASDL